MNKTVNPRLMLTLMLLAILVSPVQYVLIDDAIAAEAEAPKADGEDADGETKKKDGEEEPDC